MYTKEPITTELPVIIKNKVKYLATWYVYEQRICSSWKQLNLVAR